MAKWKLPPKVKIYEAFSVIADGRYKMLGNGKAETISSNHTKSYAIEWSGGYPLYMTANDNGTYYKGYLGYPMVAILMVRGKINYNPKVVEHFAKIDWNALNKAHNNDYEAAVEEILDGLKDKTDIAAIRNSVDDIINQIKHLSVHKLNNRRKPPQ